MDIKKLQRLVVDALEDVKAQDIEVFNTSHLSDLFDRVIVASGTSNRHTRSLASNVAEKVKSAGGHVVSVEGGDNGEWVLVDLGDAIVHVMQPAVRAYYSLEELWGGKRVNMKLLAEVRGSRAVGKSAIKSGGAARSKAPATAAGKGRSAPKSASKSAARVVAPAKAGATTRVKPRAESRAKPRARPAPRK